MRPRRASSARAAAKQRGKITDSATNASSHFPYAVVDLDEDDQGPGSKDRGCAS